MKSNIIITFGATYLCEIVKNWYELTFDKVFLAALMILIVVNIIAAATENTLIMETIIPLYVPVLLIFFFVKYQSLGIPFISFLMFSFLGDASFLFYSADILIQVSSIFYLLSYLCLIIMVLPKFKLFEFDKLIGAYLFVVVLIALYFLYIVFGMIKTIIINPTEVLLFGIKNLTLILLTFISFGVYLNTQTKQSTLFLTAIIFFGLSVMMNYVTLYYLFDWRFVLLQRILYAIALYVLFKYIMIRHMQLKKPKPIQLNERYPSDTILL